MAHTSNFNNLGNDVESVYEPFILEGMVSLTDSKADHIPVKMLRDTGAAQSFILTSVLPFSEDPYGGSDVLVKGIGLGLSKVSLHKVHLMSDLVLVFFLKWLYVHSYL